MLDVNTEYAGKQCEMIRQLAFNLRAAEVNNRCAKIVRHAPGNSPRYRGQTARRRNVGKRIQWRCGWINELAIQVIQRRFTNKELLLRYAIETICLQGVALTETVIEDAATTTDHHLRRLRTICCTR